MRRLLYVSVILFFSCLASAQDMAPKDCGSCHESQFKTWLTAVHNQRGVVCSACHGEFHSGMLNGCTICHNGEHKIDYNQWQFVKDYKVEGDTSDYYCIVCHDPHNPIKAKVLLCNSCHGAKNPEPQPRKSFRMGIQKAHNVFAKIAPEMDQDAWNRRMKSTERKIDDWCRSFYSCRTCDLPLFLHALRFLAVDKKEN